MGRTHRLARVVRGLCAAGLVAASLTMVGVAVAPSATAAAPPGTPWTFGENAYGQLGNGTTTTRRSGAPVNGLNGVVDLHGGREHVVALKSDGTVWTWGSNVEGQLGLGTTGNVSTPTRVTSLGNDNVAVETGHNHIVVLKADGTVWASGLNSDGQLGDGTTSLRRAPVRVQGITDATGIAAGRNMSYAIRANGQLMAWGRNDEGQLGDGTTTRRLTPVRVGASIGFGTVTMVTGGRDHGVAVLTDGSVWAWGSNNYGQIGDGTVTDRTTPVRVVASGITDAAAGAHHSYALRANGTVASWGRNYRAELGDGTTTARRTPVSVLGVSNAVTLGSGRDMGNVTLADGRVQAWGHNLYGQLGDGTTTNRTSAIVVPGISNAVKAGGGGSAYGVVLVRDAGTPPANQAPVARISGTTCSGLSCPLSGSTSTDDSRIVSYAWGFGDGSTGSGMSPGHTYATPGQYTVTLTVTDDDGATGTTTASVTASNPPPPPPNQDPVARISGTSCSGLTCSFSGSTSSDPDGTVVGHAWAFEPTGTATGVSATHTFPGPGTYGVTLTVTDDDDATGSASTSVTVSDQPATDPTFRAGAVSDANTTSAAVVVPAAVTTGDQLVLIATTNTAATHATPAGWALLDSVADGTQMRSSVYTRTAPAGFAGSTVRVALSSISKTNLSLLAYADAAPITRLASAVQGGASVTDHPAPGIDVETSGSVVLRFWADKSSSARSWDTPPGTTRRTTGNGSGGGHLASFTADVGGVPAGTVAPLDAVSSVASDKAVAWTVVTPAAADQGGDPPAPPPNQDPVARITGTSCSGLTCSFTGTASTDPDGRSWATTGPSSRRARPAARP